MFSWVGPDEVVCLPSLRTCISVVYCRYRCFPRVVVFGIRRQCACLYVLDDSFRFCISARKLSFIYLIICRRNDVANNKKIQSIYQCMAIVTNEEQHHLHYFRTSAMYKVVGESNTFVCLSVPPMENLLAGWRRKKNETYNVPADVL